MKDGISTWHDFVETQNPEILEDLLDDDVKFHSPFVWKPKLGKEITIAILTGVAKVFEEFEYVREARGENLAALEFETKVGELKMRGIDLIEFNEDGKIVDLEVMIRPANALQAVGKEMSKRLAAQDLV